MRCLVEIAKGEAGFRIDLTKTLDGRLVPVLPAWRFAPVSAWAVFPGRRLMPTRTRVFIDALTAKFSAPECQAIQAEAPKGTRRQRDSAYDL